MANMQCDTAFNINEFDLTFYALKRVSAQFKDNVNVQFGNKVYTDEFQIEALTKGHHSILSLLGPSLSVSSAEKLTSGTVTAFAEHTYADYKGYGISGISIAATAFEKAMQTTGTKDDQDILAKAFADNDTISMSKYADVMRSYGGDDVLKGNGGNDNLDAGNGNDNVFGGSGKDKIYGGKGDDIIVGGTGRDWMKGGDGSDKFIYNSRSEGGDTISKFGRTDYFAFKSENFGHLHKGQLNPDVFVLGTSTASLDKHDRFIFNTVDDTLWYDSNGTGKGGLTLIADLNTNFTVTWTDIFVI
jgi:Ca2+-binding RTX toxin-like protein